MTTKAIDLNKILVQKAQERKSLRSSGVKSINYDEKEMDNLKLPWKFNRVNSP